MERRACLVALPLLLVSGMALAGTDINAVCYEDCEAATHSNPEYKACVARAADKANAALNQAYKALHERIRAAAKEMGQGPEVQLNDLKDSQKQWIAYRDGNCTLEDSSPSVAQRSAAIIRPASARSPMSGSTTSSASGKRCLAWSESP